MVEKEGGRKGASPRGKEGAGWGAYGVIPTKGGRGGYSVIVLGCLGQSLDILGGTWAGVLGLDILTW